MLETLAPRRVPPWLAGLPLALAPWPPPAPAQAAPALSCAAPQAQAPCGAGSTRGPAPAPAPDPGIANPVHLATGEKFLRATDLPEPVSGAHPSFIRLYRSGSAEDGPLGRGWTSEYDIRLRPAPDGWRLDLPDGRRVRFDARGLGTAPTDGRILAPDPEGARARSARAGANTDRAGRAADDTGTEDSSAAWQGADGGRLFFDARGRLRTITAPGRPDTVIDRHAGGPLDGLARAIRRGDTVLRLGYDPSGPIPRLRTLDTPLGVFHYEYTQAADDAGTASTPPAGETSAPMRLSAVRRPDGMRRRYHYESGLQAGHPAAITGVTLETADGRRWRARSWTYDARGRVIQAIPGAPDATAGRLDLDYPDGPPGAGTTRIRSAGGAAEVDILARGGRTVPRTVRATSCPGCPGTTQRPGYDARGRLSAIGDLRIHHAPDGRIRALAQARGGWPGLRLDYGPDGRLARWTSRLTGTTRLTHDAHGRLTGRHRADGGRLDIRRDALGRPVLLRHAAPGEPPLEISLRWRGDRPIRLTHPEETEFLEHDAHGRVTARAVRRPRSRGGLNYRERFAYDAHGRLTRHDLPEGGALHYAWSGTGRLSRLDWEAADGARRTVIDSMPGLAGYRYGNGLWLRAAAGPDGRADTLILSEGPRVLWGERRRHDARGRIAHRTVFLASGVWRHQALAHDTQDRLIGLQDGTIRTWLIWDEDGRLAARLDRPIRPSDPAGAKADADPPPAIPRGAAGLPLAVGGRTLRYQAQGRLAEVREDGRPLVRYAYNARGQQIRRIADGEETERYYLDNRLAAIWRRPASMSTDDAGPATARATVPSALPARSPAFGVTQRYLYAHEVPVGLLQTEADGRVRLVYLHADLLGAPVLATDDDRAVRWAAGYDALGRATRLRGDLDLPLRRPGQDEDPATGWHDNVFRTFLPGRGHYLEPDPLGPLPGHQALGYAAQQPLRHVDPLGLILLAFDGTRYGPRNQSNVWKLAQAYADGPAYYHAGPGNAYYTDWDAVTAAGSRQILRNQWQSLLNALDRAQDAAAPVPIDILGYSRGAALARDFANRIARHTRDGWFSYDDPLRGTIGLCVDLRFLGLFDTVAQFGLLGAANAGFDLGIAGAWHWVAHAVALHELRTLFPLVSAAGDADNTVEAPFIGAHADIGGGLLLDERLRPIPDGDLSDVALNWMRWQALAALVPLSELAPDDRAVARPLLHDERGPALRLLAGDRALQDAAARTIGPQGADARLGDAQRRIVEAFIRRTDGADGGSGSVAGSVDMAAYGAWLETERGLPGMAAPAQRP
ncbi:phospholipase effector Tle1 domain-containing protein [Castellaniella sp. WN]